MENLELLFFETDDNQMEQSKMYLVQGTALLKDGMKPKVTFYIRILPCLIQSLINYPAFSHFDNRTTPRQ
jgi:hypothetical protein